MKRNKHLYHLTVESVCVCVSLTQPFDDNETVQSGSRTDADTGKRVDALCDRDLGCQPTLALVCCDVSVPRSTSREARRRPR